MRLGEDMPKLGKHAAQGGELARPLMVAGLSVAILMIGFEATKQFFFPHISILQSHVSTIAFTSVVSTLVSYFLIRRLVLLNWEREAAQAAVKETEERLQRLVANLPLSFMVYQLIRETDGTRRFVYLSPNVEQIHGVKAEAVLQDASLLYGQIAEQDRELLASEEDNAMKDGRAFNVEVRIRTASGGVRWIHLSSAPMRSPDGRTLWDGIESDITERKDAEVEREQLIRELQQALNNVKVLSGLLSICASCKRIRDEQGHWEQLEIYIRDRSTADFSHTCCPECLQRLYGKS
jgi:PAS domain S-box-containing protein